MMKEALVIRIHRDFVGREIPFDKVYFFHKEDEEDIPKIYPTAMVFPVNKKMATAFALILEKVGKNPAPKYKLRCEMQAYNRLSESYLKKAQKTLPLSYIADVLENPRKYLALVPVLFTKQWALSRKVKAKAKKSDVAKNKSPKDLGKKVFPQYLVAQKRRVNDRPVYLLKKMLGARSYFLYRGEKIRPICLLCPKSIDSIAGECDLGTEICYEMLGKVTEGDFIKGVKAYWKLAARIDEPELGLKETKETKETENAQLP